MKTEQLLNLICSLNEQETTSETNNHTIETPFKVGEAYFIRTVTYHATGRVKKIIGNFLVLEDAAWIADSGRFQQAIMEGTLSEVEPVDVEMYVNIESIIDGFPWKNNLPREQK